MTWRSHEDVKMAGSVGFQLYEVLEEQKYGDSEKMVFTGDRGVGSGQAGS
jgi:hypothetical protein